MVLCFCVVREAPVGIAIFDDKWSLLFANDAVLSNLNADFDELKGSLWADWFIKREPRFNHRMFPRFLRRFCTGFIENRRVILPVEKESYLVFVISIKEISFHQKTYHLLVAQDITKEREDSLRAIRFQKRFRRELKIARVAQKVINNSVVEKITAKDYIFYFHSRFMPSRYLSGDVINVTQIDQRYFSVFLGDGKGHGLPAALYSSLLYSYMNLISMEVSSGEKRLSNCDQEDQPVGLQGL